MRWPDGDLPDGHHWATLRAANLIWMLGKPQDAAAILDSLAAAPENSAQLAERLAVQEPVEGSLVVQYLNRLSDLLWAMARWQEGPDHTLSRG